MGEQATLEFDKSVGDVLLHKLVKTYKFNILRHTLCITYGHASRISKLVLNILRVLVIHNKLIAVQPIVTIDNDV